MTKNHEEMVSRLANAKRDLRDLNVARLNEQITAQEKIFGAYRDGLTDMVSAIEKAGEITAERGDFQCEYCRVELRKPLPIDGYESRVFIRNLADPYFDPYIDLDMDAKEAVPVKINFCPMCGRRLNNKKEE